MTFLGGEEIRPVRKEMLAFQKSAPMAAMRDEGPWIGIVSNEGGEKG